MGPDTVRVIDGPEMVVGFLGNGAAIKGLFSDTDLWLMLCPALHGIEIERECLVGFGNFVETGTEGFPMPSRLRYCSLSVSLEAVAEDDDDDEEEEMEVCPSTSKSDSNSTSWSELEFDLELGAVDVESAV